MSVARAAAAAAVASYLISLPLTKATTIRNEYSDADVRQPPRAPARQAAERVQSSARAPINGALHAVGKTDGYLGCLRNQGAWPARVRITQFDISFSSWFAMAGSNRGHLLQGADALMRAGLSPLIYGSAEARLSGT